MTSAVGLAHVRERWDRRCCDVRFTSTNMSATDQVR